jgi:hypothetical protein
MQRVDLPTNLALTERNYSGLSSLFLKAFLQICILTDCALRNGISTAQSGLNRGAIPACSEGLSEATPLVTRAHMQVNGAHHGVMPARQRHGTTEAGIAPRYDLGIIGRATNTRGVATLNPLLPALMAPPSCWEPERRRDRLPMGERSVSKSGCGALESPLNCRHLIPRDLNSYA